MSKHKLLRERYKATNLGLILYSDFIINNPLRELNRRFLQFQILKTVIRVTKSEEYIINAQFVFYSLVA
jgi:hypothetical protein